MDNIILFSSYSAGGGGREGLLSFNKRLPNLDMTGKREPWNMDLLGRANLLCLSRMLIIPWKKRENIFEDTVNPGST